MTNYDPELGQAAFGQPHKEFAVPVIMRAVLELIRSELSRVHWNAYQKDIIDPFDNKGDDDNFNSDVFSVHAYSWDDEEQPWNFKYGDLEISWYKYLGRGMSANKEISPDMANDVLVTCLAHLNYLDRQSR